MSAILHHTLGGMATYRVTKEADPPTPRRPQRVMIPLTREEDRHFKRLRAEDDIPTAARVRAMQLAYLEDPYVRRAVDERVPRAR
jgi:hypothetical protein